MKIKESYTLEELCTGLTIPLVKFCQMAGITEATLIRLRKGFAGRQHTINSILATFSKVYGIELSLEIVEGLTVQDKPHQKSKRPSEQEAVVQTTNHIASAPTSSAIAKRTYTRKSEPKKPDLPAGCLLATDFARLHGVAPTTFRDHMEHGLGPGLIGESTDTIPERDRVAHEERTKPGRKGEMEKYLTPEQQTAALDFWRRHGVDFTMPEAEKEHAQ